MIWPNVKSRLLDMLWAVVAITAGVLVIRLGDYLLGVRLEYYWGINTFNWAWLADLFLVPAAGGIVVSFIYGLGGKTLAYFPAPIVRIISYYEVVHFHMIPANASLLPMGFWGFVVIMVLEAGVIGGVLGEIMFKKIYGRTPKHLQHLIRKGRETRDPAATQGPVSESKE